MTASLICIGGIPGVGKTTAGRLLLEIMGPDVAFICPDETRLKILGKKAGDVITNDDLTPEITKQVIHSMIDQTISALYQGHKVIVASAFILESMRLDFETLARECKVSFHGFWLDAPFDVVYDRALKRQQSGANQTGFNNASAVVPTKNTQAGGLVSWRKINANQAPQAIVDEIVLHTQPVLPDRRDARHFIQLKK